MLNTYLIYHLINCIVLVIRTLLYIEEEQRKREGTTEGQSEKNRRNGKSKGREKNGAKDAAAIFASSSPPSVPSAPSPFTPSPAAHRFAGSHHRPRLGKGGHLVRFWVMLSPHHLAPISQSIDQQTAGQRLARLSSCPPRPLPLFQVVRAGQSTSQGGRSPPAHPADPLHPAGVRPNICGHIRRHIGGHPAITGRRGSSSRKFVLGFFARLYRSKYQLFIFSEGLSRAIPVHRGNGNCT